LHTGIYKLFSDLRRSTQFLMVSERAAVAAAVGEPRAHACAGGRVARAHVSPSPLPMTMKSVFQLTELRLADANYANVPEA
jgi:hypothetical protein